MRVLFSILLFAFTLIFHKPLFGADGVEKVNIYTGHFLLQSYPQDKRLITMEIDTTFPPDTLVFQALASKGGLHKATMELQDMAGNVIEQVNRVTLLEDETEATFIYVLNKENVMKIRDHKFRVVLDSHPEKESGIHHVALIFLDTRR
jgi:hypothetical protein